MVITEASDDVVSTRVSDMQENMSSDRNAVKKGFSHSTHSSPENSRAVSCIKKLIFL